MSSSNTTTKFADLGDVEEWQSQAKVAWIRCRSKGHNMDDHDVKLDEKANAYIVILRCTRCYTERHEVVNCDTGEVLTSKYDKHPDGYLLPKGTGRIDAQGRGLIRIARLRDTLERKRDIVELTNKRARKAK